MNKRREQKGREEKGEGQYKRGLGHICSIRPLVRNLGFAPPLTSVRISLLPQRYTVLRFIGVPVGGLSGIESTEDTHERHTMPMGIRNRKIRYVGLSSVQADKITVGLLTWILLARLFGN